MMYKYKEMNWVTQVVVMEVVALSVLNQLEIYIVCFYQYNIVSHKIY